MVPEVWDPLSKSRFFRHVVPWGARPLPRAGPVFALLMVPGPEKRLPDAEIEEKRWYQKSRRRRSGSTTRLCLARGPKVPRPETGLQRLIREKIQRDVFGPPAILELGSPRSPQNSPEASTGLRRPPEAQKGSRTSTSSILEPRPSDNDDDDVDDDGGGGNDDGD